MYRPGSLWTGNMKDGKWTSQISRVGYSTSLVKFGTVSGSRSGEDGNVPWQWDYVSCTSYQPGVD